LGAALGLALAALALLVAPAPAPAAAAKAKYASIVINEKTGQVLHAHSADIRHYPASLTKLMTLYLLYEALESGRLKLSSRIKVSARAARQPASKLGIKYRSRITVRQAILGLAVKSANDVATAVAEALGGTERKFGYLMSAKAKALGMANSRFRNASGLPNRRQLTTARDIATLVRAHRRDFPQYFGYFKTRAFKYAGKRHENHNRLLDRYAGADGVKTGFIRASGFNLAASAKRDGIRLIAVVLGARSPRARDLHAMGLLERGFATASNGRLVAYPYDRNIHVTRTKGRVNQRIRVARARGARGRIRLSRLTPPRRPDFQPYVEQGSANTWAAQARVRSLTETADPYAAVTGTPSSALSAATAPAPPPQAATARPSNAANWSIQIGTFFRKSQARYALSRARKTLPRLLGATKPKIQRVRTKRGARYRARLAGLSSRTARRACRNLAIRNKPCLRINPKGRFATK
jgi:D-alanyl-D-alanine carboxypeptidase